MSMNKKSDCSVASHSLELSSYTTTSVYVVYDNPTQRYTVE